MNQSVSSSSTEENAPVFDIALPYTGGGASITRLKRSERDFKWSGPAPVIQVKGKELFLAPGLTLVSGRTGIGKTLMIQALVRASDGLLAYINLLEPFNNADEVNANPVAYDLREAIELAAVSIAMGHVPVIDSLRILTYTASGATGKRGINMGMFGYLTALNNALAQAGASMVAVINPLLDEQEDYDAFISNCRSSVVSVIEVTSTARFVVSRRPNRDKLENFSYDPSLNSEIPRSPLLQPSGSISASANFPRSQSNSATRNRVNQLGANSTGEMVKGKVDFLN